MNIQLVDDWKQSWRWLSVRFAAALALVPELIYRLAEVFERLLPALSAPVLDNLPPWLRAVTAALALVAVFLRLVKQGAKPDDTDTAGA